MTSLSPSMLKQRLYLKLKHFLFGKTIAERVGINMIWNKQDEMPTFVTKF